MMSSVAEIREKCLRRMLRPIVRFCIRGASKLQDFQDIAKAVFVEVAAEEIERRGERVNISRLSVVSGVHRKDVTKIYREKEEPSRRVSALLWRVVGRWEQDKSFINKRGTPKALICDGEGSEFYELVASISQNVGPLAVLFELERLGMVKRVGTRIRLLKTVPRFNRDPEEGYELLADDMESLVEAVEENILEDKEVRNLHIRTECSKVAQRDIETVRRWLLEEGKAFHKRCRDFLALYDRDINPAQDDDPVARVNVTAFSLTEER